MLSRPPLSLYIHMPWCEKKCPYCDFNSYKLPSIEGLYQDYINALIVDLKEQIALLNKHNIDLKRTHLIGIYIGGGTPSLCPTKFYEPLFDFIYKNFSIDKDTEITAEVNPKSSIESTLVGFKTLGINRISMGVQSLNDKSLKLLGRIHNKQMAIDAITLVKKHFNNFNLDLMHSLPFQSVDDALDDINILLNFNPPHLSWYELTLEENTQFGQNPPECLPNDETNQLINDEGNKLLLSKGYTHYEVSAYAKENMKAKHNSNYWHYGDYLAIGAGAHSKITLENDILRTFRIANPKEYIKNILSNIPYKEERIVPKNELPFEFFLNRFRIFEEFNLKEYEMFTGLSLDTVLPKLNSFANEGLLIISKDNTLKLTSKGELFINHMLEELL